MARPVLHHQDAYVLWSTVLDAPPTTGMTRQEMVRELLNRGDRSMPLILEAIEMAMAYGTSFVDDGDDPERDVTALDVISGNRAGAHESCIEPEELLPILFVERAPLERIPTTAGFDRSGRRRTAVCAAIVHTGSPSIEAASSAGFAS